MNKHIITILLLLTSTALIAQPPPDRDSNKDATFTDEGIWHKNMELICPIIIEDDSSGQWNEMMEITKVNSSLGKQLFFIGGFNFINNENHSEDYSYIQVDNLTNPRQPQINFRRIYVQNNNEPVRLGHCATWDSGTNVYAVCTVFDDRSTSLSIKAIIINLTELLEWGKEEVIITNLEDRSKTYDNITSLNINSDIYLGYIEEIEEYFKIARCEIGFDEPYVSQHTMTVDKKSSVLTFSHNINSYYDDYIDGNDTIRTTDGFVDVVVLNGIPGNTNSYYGIENHPDYTSTTEPISVSRLMKDGRPIRFTLNDENPTSDPNIIPNEWPEASAVHETHAHGIKKFDINGNPTMETETNMISLNLACASNIYSTDYFAARECGKVPESLYVAQGGFAIIDIDYSGNPFECVVKFQQWVKADPDRQNPNVQESPETFVEDTDDRWARNLGHSIEPVHIDLKNHFFVSMQELAAPTVLLLDDDEGHVPTTFTSVGGAYISEKGSISLNLNDGIFDDRRLSNNLKLWGGDRGHHLMRGIGSENQSNPSSSTWDDITSGPLSAYDVLEQSVSDRNSGSFFPVQHIDEVEDIDCDPGINESRAPNSIHHVRTLNGSYGELPIIEDFRLRSELFIGAYAGGARILDIKNFIRTDAISNDITYAKDTILENAYFDFMPTLTYDPDDRYFYMLAGSDDYDDYEFKYSPKDIGIMNYYIGVFDLFPDSRRDSLKHDEDFVYALMGPNGKQMPFCKNGGYMIYRYFRDEIGGVINGNNPGTEVLYQDMKFRKVNLQGDFKVQRDVTIADGAEVWLMPGEEGSGKTHDNMEFLVGDDGERTIYVDGTLHISVEDGNEGGSNITIEVPIIVRDGGKLYIHNIRSGKDRVVNLKRKVTVNSGGLFEITEDAKVIIDELFADNGSTFHIKNGAEITLNNSYSASHGIARIQGTVSNPITISGYIPLVDVVGLDMDELDSYSIFNFKGGTTINPVDDELLIEHTIFKGAHISVSDKNVIKIEDNEFYDKTDEYYASYLSGFTPQLTAIVSSTKGLLPSFFNLNIKNNIFEDLSSSTTLIYKKINGLSTYGEFYLTIEGNQFENLINGAIVDKASTSIIKNNTFDEMLIGLNLRSTSGKICNNEFELNNYGILADKSNTFTVYDNELNSVGIGLKAIDGGGQKFRNNEFTNYYQAIWQENSTAFLRGTKKDNPQLSCSPNNSITYLGRNVFYNVDNLVFNNPYINYADDPNRADIFLYHKNSRAFLDCGYNNMSQNTPNHIYYKKEFPSDPNKTIDGSNNDWNDVSGHLPRTTNVAITGSPINVSETASPSCEIGEVCSCVPLSIGPVSCFDNYTNVKVNSGNWVEIALTDSADTFFDDAFDFYHTHLEDVTLTEPCRNDFAVNLLGTAVYGDSNSVKITLMNSLLNTMYMDTLYTNYERVNLGYILAEGYERLEILDSALLVLENIQPLDTQTYYSRADWDIDRIKSKQFTDVDSINYYFDEYLDKLNERIKIRFDTTGYSMKTANQFLVESGINENKLFKNDPNPFSSVTEISYYLSEEDIIKISVTDRTGKEVLKAFEGIQNEGLHRLQLNLENLSSGVYFYILETRQGKLLEKMYLVK